MICIFLELTLTVDEGASPVSYSRAASTASPSTNNRPNMYARLTQDAPELTGELQLTVKTILDGKNSMIPEHIDVMGLAGTGIRWWRVAPDFVKRLYFECFKLCTISQEYLAMAPVEVQDMVAALEASSRTVQDRAAEISLANAVSEDQAERYSKFNSNSAFSTDMVASIMRHRQRLPINLAQLYPSNYSAFSVRSTNTTTTQNRDIQVAPQGVPDLASDNEYSMISEDEESLDNNSTGSDSTSSEDTGSDDDGPVFPAKRLKRSRISVRGANLHDDVDSDDVDSENDEPIRPSKRVRR
jgi:hypothetical protein